MIHLSDDERRQAFWFFYARHWPYHRTDELVKPFLNAEFSGFAWLQNVRQARLMTAKQVAAKLNISRQAYSEWEVKEAGGKLTLADAKKAAEALDCELVYAFRPKNRLPFLSPVWDVLFSVVRHDKRIAQANKFRRYGRVAYLAGHLLQNADFRRRMKWADLRRPVFHPRA